MIVVMDRMRQSLDETHKLLKSGQLRVIVSEAPPGTEKEPQIPRRP